MAPEVTQVHDEPFQELAWPEEHGDRPGIVIVPDEVIGPPDSPLPVPTEVTVPEPPPPPEGQEVMQLEAIQKPMLDLMWPMTSSFCEGEAVPMPTLPTGTPKPREPAKPPLFTMRAPCFIWLPVPTLIGSGALLDGGAPVGGFQAARDMPIEAMATVDIAAIKYFFMVLYLNCTLLLALP